MCPTLSDPVQTREDLLPEVMRVLVHAREAGVVEHLDGSILEAAVVQVTPTSDPWVVEVMRHLLRFVRRSSSIDVLATLGRWGLSTEKRPDVRTAEMYYPVLEDPRWFPDGLPDTPRPAWFPVELERAAIPIRDRELLTLVLDKLILVTKQFEAQLDPDLDAHYEAMISELSQRAKERNTDIEAELENVLQRAAERAAPRGWSGGSWAELVAGWTGPWLLNALADELGIPRAVRHRELTPDGDEEQPTAAQRRVALHTDGLRSAERLTYFLLRLRHGRAGLSESEAKREAARQAWPSVGLAQALGNADKADFDWRRRHAAGPP